ncbi:DUF6159 family protein [bacterium]|nr:DUF6159 family protein [bacterium]
MGKISRTFELMRASWEVLKKDKEMLIFPLISGVCCLLIFASFIYPLYTGGHLQNSNDKEFGNYFVFFIYYFCNYFVMIFFNAAIVACAKIRMDGGDPTVSDGLKAAASRITSIAGWALVSATVGMILRMIEERSNIVGSIVASLIGLAWTVVSFLVIPVLIIENKGPIESLKESTRLLKKTWGEQLIGNFSFGLVFFLLAIPAFLLILLTVFAGGGMSVLFFSIGIAVLYLILLALVQSTLQAIFQTALYLHVSKGKTAVGFESWMLEDSIGKKQKKSRGIF